MTQPTEGARQRRYPRFHVSLPAFGLAAQFGAGKIRGVVRDISPGGLMVQFPVLIVPGNRLALVLHTQDGPVAAEGKVVWTAPRGAWVRHAVAFSELKQRDFAMKIFLAEGR